MFASRAAIQNCRDAIYRVSARDAIYCVSTLFSIITVRRDKSRLYIISNRQINFIILSDIDKIKMTAIIVFVDLAKRQRREKCQ